MGDHWTMGTAVSVIAQTHSVALSVRLMSTNVNLRFPVSTAHAAIPRVDLFVSAMQDSLATTVP